METGEASTWFVDPSSIVRQIWGNGDTILLVFAGCAAEFALSRAVDWLFFTGKLPADPIGRLLSTAGYAQQIVFADGVTASKTLSRIRSAHAAVELKRGARIPDWAHRDVLYMLIDYSERAHMMLARKLTSGEQKELYDVFHRVGQGLRIPELPATYAQWREDRERHMLRDLHRSTLTDALYTRYLEHLGGARYRLLRHVQSVLVPDHVRDLLQIRRAGWLQAASTLYPLVVGGGLRPLLRYLLIPPRIRAHTGKLDRQPAARFLETPSVQ